MLFLLSIKCCCIVVWQTKCIVCEKCFSCWLSLQKRQEMKFSHTEWGTWVQARMSVSRSITWLGFSFLVGHCNSFPALPPLSGLLPRVYSWRVSTFWVVFSPFVDSYSVIIVMLIEVSIKCSLPCGRQNAFSVWEMIKRFMESWSWEPNAKFFNTQVIQQWF